MLVGPGAKPKLQAAQKSLSDLLSITTNRPFRLIWELLGLGGGLGRKTTVFEHFWAQAWKSDVFQQVLLKTNVKKLKMGIHRVFACRPRGEAEIAGGPKKPL